jgi:hypothetical protein
MTWSLICLAIAASHAGIALFFRRLVKVSMPDLEEGKQHRADGFCIGVWMSSAVTAKIWAMAAAVAGFWALVQ